MERQRFTPYSTISTFRDPEQLQTYIEESTVSGLLRNINLAVKEGKESLQSYKASCSSLHSELNVMKEHIEKDTNDLNPLVGTKLNELIEQMREEFVQLTSENMRIDKQIKCLEKEQKTLEQQSNEYVGRSDKIVSWLQQEW
ncbi:unnamed protein product [Blepharisma stoltei]|uniref:Uncharacterized protein n=1 Tax=Blepharisma stoltei TaxID=1481888 RepID=A0AAU9K5T4_9CILI|nr:unnamed protein product [Blepharisma stoltei]